MLTGIILAAKSGNKTEVDVTGGAVVTGEVIANNIQLSNNGKINLPPVVSP